ncbi:MAG: efflux RND transporter periplasmic adaptor subunit [Nitrosomonadales bacterium]|nr:efflux RND transporter periplasmic adaptor subunit [Nitrosomonadales bacterium]
MAWLRKERHPGLLNAKAFKYVKQWFGIIAAAILIIIGFPNNDHAAIQLVGNAYAAPAASSNLDPIAPPGKNSAKPAKKLWVCPMHPDVIRDQPGTCPICGMDLVEIEQPGTPQAAHGHGVHIDTATQQKLGVRLAAAKMQTLSQDIHAYGNVAVDESLVFNLSAKVEGVIKKLHINSVGQQVHAGQVLYEINSPELLKSQNEYIDLLKERDILFAPMEAEDAHTNGKGMPEDDMTDLRVNAGKRVLVRDRLLYADVGNELIEGLIKSYKPVDVVEIRAPQSGFVTKIEVHEGSTVKPMDNLFSFVNLSRVWIEVPLYPDQLAWVKEGDEAIVKMPLSNAPEIKARLQLIPPVVDSTTRTVQARLSVNNAKNPLPIGAFLDVVIHANPHKALAIPRSAVMRTGKGDLVMLAEGGGHFTPVKVEIGIETTDSIEITAGLRAGDQVAVNGQFLLDAAASMSDAAQRLQNHDAGDH